MWRNFSANGSGIILNIIFLFLVLAKLYCAIVSILICYTDTYAIHCSYPYR